MQSYNLSSLGFIRVAASSPKIRVGDVHYNTQQIELAISEAVKNDCQLIVFPELSLTGYTCGDLFFQDSLLKGCLTAIERLEDYTAQTSANIVIGTPLVSSDRLYNCAVFISQGKTLGVVPKTYLCNSSEYYEERWFSSELDRFEDTIKIPRCFPSVIPISHAKLSLEKTMAANHNSISPASLKESSATRSALNNPGYIRINNKFLKNERIDSMESLLFIKTVIDAKIKNKSRDTTVLTHIISSEALSLCTRRPVIYAARGGMSPAIITAV